MRYGSILCITGDSDRPGKTEREAARLSSLVGCRLILLHVIEKCYNSGFLATDSPLGFVPGSLVTGLAYEQRHDVIRVLGIGAGLFLIFFIGMTWLSVSTGMSALAAFLVGVVPFLPGDALKGAALFFIARRLEGLGIGPWGLKQTGVE